MKVAVAAAIQEYFPWDKHPQTLIPRTGWIRQMWCKIFGHMWRKWYWGGVHDMFDADCCYCCHKMRGPLPHDRDTPDFPSRIM